MGARHVGDDHVRVQLRVECPRSAVLIGGCDEPFRSLAYDAVPAEANDACFVLQIAEGSLPRSEMRLVHLMAKILVTEGMQKAHTLRRGEDEVEPAYRSESLLLELATA
jgi:hypothetical protein